MIQYHVYPGGKKRVVTFSYDDGSLNDERLVELFNKYKVKATFHLNGLNYTEIDDCEAKRLRSLYSGHEISCHTLRHGWPSRMPKVSLNTEVIEDRKILERIAGYTVVGMSYPSGSYNKTAEQVLDSCGIVYSRTTVSSGNFGFPDNWLEWHPSCHHRDALPLCEKFVSDIDSEWTKPLLYIWGHSHEFRNEADWAYMEKVVGIIAENDKIWYASNIEIYDYMTALERLRISADERVFVNPTSIDLWIEKDKSLILRIPAGETVKI